MDAITTVAICASVIGEVGIILDSLTTYVGVFVKKVATEGGSSSFAQWSAKAPWRLVVRPAVVGAGLAILVLKVPIAAILMAAFAAVMGYQAAFHNKKINGGWL